MGLPAAWVDIYNSAGTTKQGDGPIRTLTEWNSHPLLDKSGEFTFTMPADDARRLLLVEKRQAWCYTSHKGVDTLVGAGIIDRIEYQKSEQGEPGTVVVSGNDLLYELAGRGVGNLKICEQGYTYLDSDRGIVGTMTPGSPAWHHAADIHDANLSTYDNIHISVIQAGFEYLYVGYDARMYKLRVTVGPSPNTYTSVLHMQYFSTVNGWVDITIADGTSSGGKTLAVTGEITWTDPGADWIRVQAEESAGNWYFVRFHLNSGSCPGADIAEIEAYADIPTTNGIALIMAFAPAGWTTTEHTVTAKTAYLEFNDNTVLAALQALAEATGEHFRLGSGRDLDWLQTDTADASIRLVSGGSPGAVEANTAVAIIGPLKEIRDAYPLISRIIPYGGGMGTARPTLAQTDKSPPSGYTLDTVNNFLRCDATEGSYGRIEKVVSFPNVISLTRDSKTEGLKLTSNQLYDAGYEYLKDHKDPQYAYEASVEVFGLALLPGQRVKMECEEWVAGTKVTDINKYVYIMGATHSLNAAGLFTSALEVATVFHKPKTDGDAVVDNIRTVQEIVSQGGSVTVERVITTISSDNVDINGGEIDGTPIGDDSPSSGKFTTLSALNVPTLPAQTENKFFGGPAAAPAAVPDFRVLAWADISAIAVPTSRQIIAGAGLTGGGDLSADRTLNVGAGTLITVNADDVALSVGSAQYQVPVTGASPFTPGWTLLSTFAGAGLAWGSGVFDVGAGDGIAVAANAVAVALSTAAGLQLAGTPKTLEMGAPSTATAASTNAVSAATHSHAVTATADGAANHSTLLKSGTSGELQLDYADLLTDLTVPEINAAAALTLKPATDLILDPTSNLVKLTNAVSIQADNFASQTTGWRVTYEGAGDFRYLFADEMHVKSFIADLEQALAGGQIICKSVSTLAVAYTLPAAGGASTVWIKDLPSAENMAVFQSGDLIRFRQFSRAAGELTVADAWGVVTAYADQANKMQTWTFTRSAGGLAGTASGVIPIDAIVLDYGVTGNGYYEVNAIDGLYADNSPYAQVVTWNSHPLTTLAVRMRMGNLHGIFSVDNEHGLFAGTGVATTSRYLRISNEGAGLHNIPLMLYAGGANPTIKLDGGVVAGAPVEPYIAIGATLPTDPLVGDGIWMGLDPGTADYEFRVGTVVAGTLVKGIHWDGTSLDIRGNLIVGPGHGFVLESPSMVCAYDGPRPYATDYQVDLSGHLGQKGTIVGAVIGRPGKFSKALQTGGAATNLIYNPVFGGTYSSGLAPSVTESDAGATITPTENTDMAYIEYGTKSQKLVFTGSGSYYVLLDHGTMTNSTTYTWYLRFYLAAGSFRVMSNLGSGSHYEDFSTLGWNTYCYTGATAGSGSSFEFYLYSAAGATVYLTRSQITTLAYNTPLISGDLPGHTWAGTAYASTSARVASYVTYVIGDVIKNARKGSVGLWYYCEGWNTGFLWQAGNGNEQLDAHVNPSGILIFRVRGYSASLASGTVRAWHHAVCTWDSDSDLMYVYVDGLPSDHAHFEAIAPTLHASTFATGCSVPLGTTVGHPGYLCDLFVTEAVLTADQVRQIYQSGLPVVATRNPMSLLLTGAGRGKVEGSAGGIFGLDSAGKPTFSLLNEATTVNGEALGIGDVLLGDNTASKANLLWDQSAGKLLFRGGTTMQVEIGTDGKLSAGGGHVLLSAAGIAISAVTDAYSSVAEYGFDYGGAREAGFYTYVTGGTHYAHLDLYSLTGRNANMIVTTNCPADKESQILIIAGKNGASVATIELVTTNSGELRFTAGRLGFYDTVAIPKQTGVPVTAAGVHAALVALGFIEA